MRAAAQTYGWNLNNGGIALMWRGGCIIRSVFLGKIKEAFDKNPKLTNLLLDPFFKENILASQDGWRRVCAAALINGIPAPAFTTALCYFDGFRAKNSRPTYSRLSVTISALTLMKELTNLVGSFSIPTGPVEAVILHLQPILLNTQNRAGHGVCPIYNRTI